MTGRVGVATHRPEADRRVGDERLEVGHADKGRAVPAPGEFARQHPHRVYVSQKGRDEEGEVSQEAGPVWRATLIRANASGQGPLGCLGARLVTLARACLLDP